MPPEEIRAVLSSGDLAIARRVLELHRERLAERLADERETVDRIECSILTSAEA